MVNKELVMTTKLMEEENLEIPEENKKLTNYVGKTENTKNRHIFRTNGLQDWNIRVQRIIYHRCCGDKYCKNPEEKFRTSLDHLPKALR